MVDLIISSSSPSKEVPTSADRFYYDTQHQSSKNIQLILDGAVEIDVCGSMDPDKTESKITLKTYKLLARFSSVDQHKVKLSRGFLVKLEGYRYILWRRVRGVIPQYLAMKNY